MAVVVATAHAETAVEVVAEAEADVSENWGSDGGIDSDGGGNNSISGGGSNSGRRRQRRPKQGHDKGVMQWKGWWWWWEEQWQQGWWASDGDSNNVGDGNGNKGGGQQRGQMQGRQGQLQWQQGRMEMATAAEAISAVAAAATMAMAVAENNRNCGGRQQSTKMWQAAAIETVAVPAAIIAARLRWQVGGVVVWQKWQQWEQRQQQQIPPFTFGHGERWWERRYVSFLTKDGDVEPFYVCDFFTLISSAPVGQSKGPTKFLCLCTINT